MTKNITFERLQYALEGLTAARYIDYGMEPKLNIDPNLIEGNMLHRLAPREGTDEMWHSLTGHVIDRIGLVRLELENAAQPKKGYHLGGYACYAKKRHKYMWSTSPSRIAAEMNKSKMFSFIVSTGDVHRAQRKLVGEKRASRWSRADIRASEGRDTASREGRDGVQVAARG